MVLTNFEIHLQHNKNLHVDRHGIEAPKKKTFSWCPFQFDGSILTLFGFCNGFGGSNSSSLWPLGLFYAIVLFRLYSVGVEISISWALESSCAIAFVC
jgi:hypothetical protein